MDSYSQEIPSGRGLYVYRLWAGADCLYVGRVGDNGPTRLKRRLGQHQRTKAWWSDVTHIDCIQVDSHDELIAEELAQITKLEPRHNKVLLSRCRNGHDLTLPGARTEDRDCKACRTEARRRYAVKNKERIDLYQATYRQKQEVKQRKLDYSRTPRAKEKRRERAQQPATRRKVAEYQSIPAVKAQRAATQRLRQRRPPPGQEALW